MTLAAALFASPTTAFAHPHKPALPVEFEVVATSPDPAWVLRIKNPSKEPIRVVADPLLLSLEVTHHKSQKRLCKLPESMRPDRAKRDRTLVLLPGETYEERIDPRLYCFGRDTLLLAPGSTFVPRYGFDRFGSRVVATEGDPRGDAFESPKVLEGKPIIFPAKEESSKSPPERHRSGPDRSPGHVDIYAEERVGAPRGRDLTIAVRHVNEGGEPIAAVLRTRMVHFKVEELRPDNTARATRECEHDPRTHAAATEMLDRVRPGNARTHSLLVAEVCPRGTFDRPGLYRVTPTLGATIGGESLKADPWQGKTSALQSVLVRIEAGPLPFHVGGPLKSVAAPAVTPNNDNAVPPERPSPSEVADPSEAASPKSGSAPQ